MAIHKHSEVVEALPNATDSARRWAIAKFLRSRYLFRNRLLCSNCWTCKAESWRHLCTRITFEVQLEPVALATEPTIVIGAASYSKWCWDCHVDLHNLLVGQACRLSTPSSNSACTRSGSARHWVPIWAFETTPLNWVIVHPLIRLQCPQWCLPLDWLLESVGRLCFWV